MTEPDPNDPISATDCLARFREARARVDSLADRVTSWRAESAEGWTAKDYLAHLTAWQRRMVRWFEEGAAGQFRERPEPDFKFEQLDELNDHDWRAARATPLETVRAEFAATADAVEALIAMLSDEDLNDAARAPWLGFEARHTIAGNTYGHYQEHFHALEQLARVPA
jgi:hypothetical protein